MIAATAALSALRAHWKLVAGVGVIIALGVLLMLYRGEKRHRVDAEAKLALEVQGRKQDRAAYSNAQAAARALNKAQVAKIEAEQERISSDVTQDYAGDLARLRAELGRVRVKAAAPAQRPAGSAATGQDGKAAARADEAASVHIPPSLVLRGAETELQLDALITWVERQVAVER